MILVILRKISWKHLLCYVPGCLLFFPWLFLSLYYKGGELQNFWIDVPQWKELFWIVLFYVNGNRVLWYLCLLTGGLLVLRALFVLRKPNFSEKAEVMLSAFNVAVVAWVIGVVYI